MNIAALAKTLSEEEVHSRTFDIIKRMKSKIDQEKGLLEEAEKANEIYVPKEPSLLIAVRIKGINGVHPKARKALQLLRLNKVNTATFVLNNAATKGLLHLAKTHIAYGYPSLELVRELMYKRGLCRVDGQRVNITQEAMAYRFDGMVSTIEEMVEILFEGKENASAVNKFLWPFKLNAPKGGFARRKALDFVEGGSTGNHRHMIDQLIRRMI